MAAFFAGAIADDTADIDIYVDYPVGLWSLAGSATQNPLASTVKRSYFYSVEVQMAPSQTFDITNRWGGLGTNGFASVEFWIRGAIAGGQDMSVSARVAGNYRTVQPLSRYVTVSPTIWRRVRIPLADLGVNPADLVQIVRLQAGTSAVSPFLIDDIKLIKAPVLGTVNFTVNASTTLRTLSKRMFGVGTFCWDPVMNTADTKAKLAAGGISFFNFPGGTSSDLYDWQTNTHVLTGETAAVSTDNYLQFASDVGADKMLTVNYGSGTPQEAAAWVQYVNITKGANVKYWSIGNESYHTDHYDERDPPFQHDAETYAAFVSQCITLMKAVDPSIKIGVVGTLEEASWPSRTTVFNPRTGAPANGWGAVVLSKLAEAGTLPDYWDFHWYALAPQTESDATLLQMPERIHFLNGRMRQMLSDYMGSYGATLPVLLTENNSVWMPIGRQSTSMTNALYLADFWGNCALVGLEAFVWWNLHNGSETTGNFHPSLYGWRSSGTYGILSQGVPVGVADPVNTPYPTYYAFKALSKFARDGDSLLQLSGTNPLVSVYAVRSLTTNRVKLLVINKAKLKDYTVMTSFAGYSPPASAVVHRYGKTQDSARQDLYRYSTSTQLRTVGGLPTIRMTFARYSISVVEL